MSIPLLTSYVSNSALTKQSVTSGRQRKSFSKHVISVTQSPLVALSSNTQRHPAIRDTNELTALKNTLLKRKAMRVLYPKCIDQESADVNHVSELIRSGDGQYHMLNVVSKRVDKRPEGAGWVFVILDDSPDQVFCGKADYKNVHGHTSLSGIREHHTYRERGVYFAGELVFKEGELVSWSNSSGHFLPPRELAFTNLLPPIRLILPIHLFRPDDCSLPI